jgi:hypothetical protein
MSRFGRIRKPHSARVAVMTEEGRRALKNDFYAADPLGALLLEIAIRAGGEIEANNLDDVAEQLLDHYGSAEFALQAVRSGEVEFEEIQP